MPYKDRETQLRAQREWYQSNKATQSERNAHRNRTLVTYVRTVKEASPCVDCGVSYPFYVMQFDHTGTDKILNVNVLTRSSGIEKVKSEIAKCDLVCANCHAVRTWTRSTKK